MKLRNIVATILISAATAFGCLFIYGKYFSAQSGPYQNGSNVLPVNYVRYTGDVKTTAAPTGFEQAASIAIPTAVHIKTKTAPRQVNNGMAGNNPLQDLFGGDDPFSQFFGGGRKYVIPGEMASGSGVIISDDGYIVTNNHVIDGADEITVTLNNKDVYKAKVVGADPNTDLALLKIDAHNLPYILYGNSDDVQVGQWVLAVGYPLDLETTVTSGIVSAKSRQIGINQSANAIESYIQTDAAVNPGNSGGPLVNTSGQLIGITSAIASPTGSFAGYAYAVPVNIVKKVVNDLLKYGTVQRAYLGVQLNVPRGTLTPASFDKTNNDNIAGVYVAGVMPGSGAAAAGLQKGDIITKVNDDVINSEPELLGKIASYRPGDKVNVTFERDGKEKAVVVTLKNREGTTGLVTTTILDKLGAGFETLPKEAAHKLGIPGGVLVTNIGSGIIQQQTNMHPHFVITQVGKYPVTNTDQLRMALEKQGSSVQIEGIYPGYDDVYYYALNNFK